MIAESPERPSASAPSAGHTLLAREDWEEPLSRFARATALSVTLYAPDGSRCVGPLFFHPLGQLVSAAGGFEEGGDATRFEQDLVTRVRGSEAAEGALFEGGLEVRACPLKGPGDGLQGVLVYGWVFGRFPDPLVSERVARRLGLPAHRFWTAARQLLPVSEDKLAVYEGLLDALCSSTLGQILGRAALVEASRMKDEFLSTLSHELRTPVTSVQLRLETLARTLDSSDPRLKGILEAMSRGLRSQKRLIDELLDTSRILTGKLKLELAPVNLASVLRQAVETVAPMAQAKNVRLIAEIPEAARDIQGDANRLVQLFWNLLNNAVKFTPPKGSVWVALTQKRQRIEVCVRDTGQGIEPSYLPMVFVRFYQAPSNGAGSQAGIGLGLSLAKYIVELHGGTIHAWSEGRDRGTTFTVSLPFLSTLELADPPR